MDQPMRALSPLGARCLWLRCFPKNDCVDTHTSTNDRVSSDLTKGLLENERRPPQDYYLVDAGRGRLDRECTHTISRLGSLALSVKLGASHARPCMLILDATASVAVPYRYGCAVTS